MAKRMRVNKDVTLRVRVPSELAAKIDAIAGSDGVNRSEIIRRIVGSFCGVMAKRDSGPTQTWGGSATQEEADAAALKHAAFSASLKNLTWEDYTPLFGACFVHNRWWRGAGSCPFCPEKSNG